MTLPVPDPIPPLTPGPVPPPKPVPPPTPKPGPDPDVPPTPRRATPKAAISRLALIEQGVRARFLFGAQA